jgi:hypothetical protein
MIDPAAAFASVAARVSGIMGGPYVSGTVIDQVEPVTDDGGSIVSSGAPSSRACQVQIDKASWEMHQSEGYAEGDMLFLILVVTLDGNLDTDARIMVNAGPHAGTWLVSGIAKDSLGIYWSGKGRQA